MKTTKLVAFGLVSLSVLGLSAQAVQAATYNNVQGSSAGTVSFLVDEDNNGGVVDPGTGGPGTDGPDPIEPPPGVTPPPVVGNQDMMLTYYPDFDFGEVVYDEENGNTLYAAPMAGTVAGQAVSRPLFIQVKSSVASWKVTAEAGEFTAKNVTPNSAATLKGAQIIIKNVKAYQNSEKGSAATATTNTNIDISNGAQLIGNMTGATAGEISTNSFTFGDMDPTSVTPENYQAVQLVVPGGLKISMENQYVADLTWTISDDPA